MVRHNPARDQQRSRAYAAENAIAGFMIRDLGENAGGREAQHYVDRILRSPWTRRHWPNLRPIRIELQRQNRGGATAYGTRRIVIAEHAIGRALLLHEVAHCLTHLTDDPGHGWRWAAAYLKLVRHFLGAESAAKLKSSFRANRVRFTKPRESRPASPAALAALARINAERRAARPEPPAPAETKTIEDPGDPGSWLIVWEGQLCSPTFNSQGAADICLGMYRDGRRKPELRREFAG